MLYATPIGAQAIDDIPNQGLTTSSAQQEVAPPPEQAGVTATGQDVTVHHFQVVDEDGNPIAPTGKKAPAATSTPAPQLPTKTCLAPEEYTQIHGTTATNACVCNQADNHGGIRFDNHTCPHPGPTTPPITVTVEQALASLHLPDGTPQIAPDPANNEWNAIPVGFQIWLTAGDTTPKTATLTQDSVTITITATWNHTVFQMGEKNKYGIPQTVTCTTMTQRAIDMLPVNTPSPDCGYAYQHTGTYTIIATNTWHITWTAGTFTGTFTHDITTDAALPLRIGSLRAVNVEPPA
jgi:hypothetical protein